MATTMTDNTQQGADGRAHLAYFDVRTQASFVWDGTRGAGSHRVAVCIGGYGEPTDHEIPLPFDVTDAYLGSALRLLSLFQEACAEHAATLPDYGKGTR